MNTDYLKSIDYNKLAKEVYLNAKEHGFHEETRPLAHWLCLVIGEFSEAVEADRKGRYADMDAFMRRTQFVDTTHEIWRNSFGAYIKDSVEDELSDVVIRLLDIAGMLNLHLPELFTTINPPKWGKDSLTEIVYYIIRGISLVSPVGVGSENLKVGFPDKIAEIIEVTYYLAGHLGIELHQFVQIKMEFNKQRPYKHGKEY